MADVEVLDTKVRLEEIEPIRNKMQQELEQGNRFVSYLSDASSLKRDDFTAFKSMFDAHAHAYENTTDKDKYIIRSTSVVVQEMDKILNLPTYKQTIMEESVKSFNENQFKRVGMGEVHTSDVVQKMLEKQPVIQHPFKKEYNGDKVDGVLHLRKSNTSDHYFLNKFDLSLQKQGSESIIKQTFYINSKKQVDGEDGTKQTKPDQKYTLKEAYNLLAGRPVHKLQVSKDGVEYMAWEKLNQNKVLANGNHEIKRYTQNYGFNLDKTLSNYSIKELANDVYGESLKTSIKRGNLQSATFVDKEGKEEKLYLSPNITLGSMNVYTLDKKPLSIDQQLEKGFIKPAFAEQLKESIQNIKQKQETPQQTVSSENGARKITEKENIADEKPGTKQTNRQQKNKAETATKEQKVKPPSNRPKRKP